MKIEQKTVEVQSNMQFDESYRVTIADDDEAIKMVIEKLIGAYDNPYRAVLREYTSNAYDEHVQCGQTRPVEVQMPNELSPILKVQDFGRGLTREELKGFGTIGKSTKRDSNETTGGFGMGSKSALAASSQFTVVSVKNGKRNTVIVARDENNVPHMNFLAETETDDPSGTTIIVPITDASKFDDLEDFWVGWKRGSILVDDEEPKRSVYDSSNFNSVANGVAYNDRQNISAGRDMVRVLINQVYYKLPYSKLGLSFKQWELLRYYIVKIDNGSVDIAPSRESLVYNARTTAALKERFEEVFSVSARALRKEVSKAENIYEALRKRDEMKRNGFDVTGIRWKGQGLALPGEVIKGNKVPNPQGTWANPSRDTSTKTGFRVEKTWGHLNKRDPQRYADWNRLVIVHSAGAETTYGTYNNRRAHREAFGVGEYLKGIGADGSTHFDFFITSEPVEKLNRIYRDCATLVSAEDFNAVVSKVRAEEKLAAKAAQGTKDLTRRLKVLISSGYSGAYTRDYTLSELTAMDEYEHTVVLRNMAGGFEESVRLALTTKKNYDSSKISTIEYLRGQYKVLIILAGKNDDLTDIEALLPPLTTFQALAVKALESINVTQTKLERMAARDRSNYSIDVIRYIKDTHLDMIKKKSTREWVQAVRDYRDSKSSVRGTIQWMGNWDDAVKNALDGLDTKVAAQSLPESPMTRFPLLESISTYSIKMNDVIDYINMADKYADKA